MVVRLLTRGLAGLVERPLTPEPVLLGGARECRMEMAAVLVAAGLPRGGAREAVGLLVSGSDDRVWVEVAGACIGWLPEGAGGARVGASVPVQLFGRVSPYGQLWGVGFAWLHQGDPVWTHGPQEWPLFPWVD